MIKPLALFLIIIIILSLFLIPIAIAGSVSVSISGEQNVKPGQSYTYNYDVNLNGCQAIKMGFKCNDAVIIGETKIVFEKSTLENVDYTKSGILTINIDKSAQSGDTITILASGSYTVVNESGVPETFNGAFNSYTLTVVSDEPLPPSPTEIPSSEPTVVISDDTNPTPPPEPTVTSTPKPSPKSSKTPKDSSIADNSAEPMQIDENDDTDTIPVSEVKPIDMWNTLRTKLDLVKPDEQIMVSIEPSSVDTILPGSLLEALKAKRCIVVINLGDYSCTIMAAELGNSISSPVNLSMNLADEVEPLDDIDTIDAYQLNFSQVGDFPGCFIYNFKAYNHKPGDVLYLYRYHTESGISEYKQSAVVDNNGCLSFDIYEGGEYIVSPSLDKENPQTKDEKQTNSVTPTFLMIIIPAFCVILTILAIILFIRQKKTA